MLLTRSPTVVFGSETKWGECSQNIPNSFNYSVGRKHSCIIRSIHPPKKVFCIYGVGHVFTTHDYNTITVQTALQESIHYCHRWCIRSGITMPPKMPGGFRRQAVDYAKLVGLSSVSQPMQHLQLIRILSVRPTNKRLLRSWKNLQEKFSRKKAIGFIRLYCGMARMILACYKGYYSVMYWDRPTPKLHSSVTVSGTDLVGVVVHRQRMYENKLRKDICGVRFEWSSTLVDVHRSRLEINNLIT